MTVGRVGVVACGALSLSIGRVAAARGWPVDVRPLPPLLHNRPERIAAAVEAALAELAAQDPPYARLAVAYADCGTYGALDEVCDRLGAARLAGDHCYDVYAGVQRLREVFEAEPGTYVLTDFLAASFRRTVVAELGLDRHPGLHEDYFRHYRRVVWLAQRPTPALEEAAADAAAFLRLPLERVDVGEDGLAQGLERLVTGAA